MFSCMALRLCKKLLFAVIAEFICYNDINFKNEWETVGFIFIFLVKSYGDVVDMATMFTALATAMMLSFVALIKRTMYFHS